MNDLYRHELRLFQNLFLPSVKLRRKDRVGARLIRRDDPAQTPFERVVASPQADPQPVATLQHLRETCNPVDLSSTIDQKLARIYQMATHHRRPSTSDTKTPT